jgi:hypothetical protein
MNRITLLAASLAFAAMGSGCYWEHYYYPVEPGDPLDARLSLNWAIDGEGAPVTCASIGADTVRVVSNNTKTGEVFTDMLPCTAGSGTTAPLDAGDYAVTVELANCNGSMRCTSPTVCATVSHFGTIAIWNDGIFEVAPVVFFVNPLGSVTK